jgi:ribosomal protein L10
MSKILVTNVDDEIRRTLGMHAASLGVSRNTLILWVLEEAASPYTEIFQKLLQRAEEVERENTKIILHDASVPTPSVRTRPMKVGR